MREPLEVYGKDTLHTFTLRGKRILMTVRYKGVPIKRASVYLSSDELIKWLIEQMRQPALSAEDKLRQGSGIGSIQSNT